jgi:hypothetical protein
MLMMIGPWLRRVALKKMSQPQVLWRKGVKNLLRPRILVGRYAIFSTLEARDEIFNKLGFHVRKDTFIHCHSLAGYY